MESIVTGFLMGSTQTRSSASSASTLWDEPLDGVRARFGLAGARVVGEGIRAAA